MLVLERKPFDRVSDRQAPLSAAGLSGGESLVGLFGRVQLWAAFVALSGFLLVIFAIGAIQGGPSMAADASSSIAGRSASSAAVAASPSFDPTEEMVVIARSGDSLWSIAQDLRPDSDPRPLVWALRDRNGGSEIAVGQEIVVPLRLLE